MKNRVHESDPRGYELRFAGPEKFQKPASARVSLPGNIKIEQRRPTESEFLDIGKSVNWTHNPEIIPTVLANSGYGVVAIDISSTPEPKTVGMLRIIGDGASCYQILDVAVMPTHQNQRIGTAPVETAMQWLHQPPRRGAFVSLFTLKPSFYERLGFKTDIGLHIKS